MENLKDTLKYWEDRAESKERQGDKKNKKMVKDMNKIDIRIIERAIADIERWKGMAYEEDDEVGNAIEVIKEVLKKY